MGRRLSRDEYPMWVQLSLFGLPNRLAVWAFVWLSLLAAAGLTGYLLWKENSRWPAGLLFLLAALAYWLAIRWVDQNGTWDSGSVGPESRGESK